MDEKDIITDRKDLQPPAQSTAELSETSQPLAETVGKMKEQSQDEAKRLTAPESMGKPQEMTDACSIMKDEIYRDAQDSLASPQAGTDARKQNVYSQPDTIDRPSPERDREPTTSKK